ncbi:hypothetical protein CAOG_005542 [Capsaspora owczarzaki ATCC 30864]|uniref:Disease resistance R13L4/SHOC-2-like LRR domain-containing protein n=2 Tax=Capsaspora owczarzaki (strain ATCC 30864) TaxID=595528 RepID=A0A0D2VUE8_CAPO3|nr:hypothetical protein CAOG_005542 [Capsaspora owczarzaki ATCC 30864]
MLSVSDTPLVDGQVGPVVDVRNDAPLKQRLTLQQLLDTRLDTLAAEFQVDTTVYRKQISTVGGIVGLTYAPTFNAITKHLARAVDELDWSAVNEDGEIQNSGWKLCPRAHKQLPSCIFDMVHLHTLNLAGVTLETLPSSIGAMAQLKVLNLTMCGLSSLPREIGQLGQLEQLHVGSNHLKELPWTIVACTQLQELSLNDNWFAAIPGVVLLLPKLQRLRRLGNYSWHGSSVPMQSNETANLAAAPPTLLDLAGQVALRFCHSPQDYEFLATMPCLRDDLDRIMQDTSICIICSKHFSQQRSKWYLTRAIFEHFLGNRMVQFSIWACSDRCHAATHARIAQLQAADCCGELSPDASTEDSNNPISGSFVKPPTYTATIKRRFRALFCLS